MPFDEPTPPGEPTTSELESDQRLELLLDELVTRDAAQVSLPPDFTARLIENRPFAPWEVRRAPAYRLPAAVGAALVAGSAALFLTPLSDLGPGAALDLWGHLVAVAVGRPLATLASSWSLMAEAAGRVGQLVPGSLVALAGVGSASALALLVYALRGRKAVADEAAR